MLGGPIDVNAKDEKGYTALHCAATNGELEKVRALVLEYGADMNAVSTHEGLTPFYCAVLNHQFEVAEFLIQAGFDPKQNIHGMPLLHHVIMSCSIKMVRWLLQAGHCDVHAITAEQSTALHIAVLNGKIAYVKLLIEAGINLNAQDSRGNTALHYALLQHKKDSDAFGIMALFLIENGASVTIKNSKQESVDCYIFTSGDNFKLIKALKAKKTPYDHGFEFLRAVIDRDAELMGDLLHKNVSAHRKTIGAQNALHLAVNTGELPMVLVVLSQQIDINWADNKGRTAVFFLSEGEALEVILSVLMQAGATLDHVDDNGDTVLHYATQHQAAVGWMCTLMQYKPPVNVQNKCGGTALHLAAAVGCLTDVEVLLAHGANPNLQDNTGETALHLALRGAQKTKKEGFVRCARHLLAKGASLTLANQAGETPKSILEQEDPWVWPSVINLLMKKHAFSPEQEQIFAARLKDPEGAPQVPSTLTIIQLPPAALVQRSMQAAVREDVGFYRLKVANKR